VHVERLIEAAVAPLRKELVEVKEALQRPLLADRSRPGLSKPRPPSPARQAEVEGYVLEAVQQSPGITANQAVGPAPVQRNAGLVAVRALLAKGAIEYRRKLLYPAGLPGRALPE
jgi:hypothetical protein